MCQFRGPFLVIRTPSLVTVEIHRSRKAKPFVVHIDKVKPYWAATPKSWLAEPNLVDSDEKHIDDVMAEHPLNQPEEVRLDSEVIPTTSSPKSMDTYAVDEASIRTRRSERSDPNGLTDLAQIWHKAGQYRPKLIP